MEAADDTCYRVLDIEDAIELRIIDAKFLTNKFEKTLNLGAEDKKRIKDCVSDRSRTGLLRARIIGCLIKELTEVFKKRYDKIMNGDFDGSLLDDESSGPVCKALVKAYKTIEEDVFTSRRKAIIEASSFSIMGDLLQAFVSAAGELSGEGELSFITKKIRDFVVKLPGESNDLYPSLMRSLDYISGMTDHYCHELRSQMRGYGDSIKNIF